MANHEKEVSVAERQIYILSLLSQNPIGYSVDEIVDKLKKWDIVLTRRTIQRDIDELSMSYAIEEEERNGKTYFLARKFSMNNVDLTIQDLMAISFMQQLLQQYNHTIMGAAAEEMLKKIVKSTGNLNRKHIEDLSKSIRISDESTWKNQDVKPEIEQMITGAIEKQTKIRIQYHSWNSDEVTSRVIHPYSITVVDQYLCVEGFCELRQEIRTFRLSRIQEVEPLKERFQIPEDYQEQQNRKRFIYLSGEKTEKLVIQFNRTISRYVKEYEAHRADRLTENEDGLLFEKQTAITPEVLQWILKFGSGAKVLQPVNLQAQMKEEIKQMLAQYEETDSAVSDKKRQ